MSETETLERNKQVAEAFRQWEDGAITYVELLGFVESKLTQDDVDEHNAYLPPEQHLRFKQQGA